MRPVPVYPDYKTARPPAVARWIAAAALLVLLSGSITALMPSTQNKTSLMTAGILLSLLLAGTGWLIRLLYYRVSMHNAAFYRELVEYERQQWWVQHRQPIGLQEVILLGPAAKRATDWVRVLHRGQRPPEETKEGGGSALRLPQISATGIVVREKRLAELLVTEWQKQRSDKAFASPQRCYWQGTDASWQAFHARMAMAFPLIKLPLQPELWQGEASLAEIASGLAEAESNDTTMLIAGCQSVATQPGSALPAGESAVLWLVGQHGPVQTTRGEAFSMENGDTLPAVCTRALKQSELTDPPEACPLFYRPDLDALAQSGWDISQHLQDAHWGDIDNMEALTVLSLAAIYAAHHQQPCGWIARDPINTLTLGIVNLMDKVNKPAAISVAATATVCIAVVTLLVMLGGLGWWLWGTDRAMDWDALRPLIAVGFIVWGMSLSLLVLGFIAFRLLIKDKIGQPASCKPKPAAVNGPGTVYAPLKTHLRNRYSLLWRRKVRLLLVVGDDVARAALLPGLQERRWLEGQRTVLIDGGSLGAEPDADTLAALRKLRRRRPLDGIVRVLGAGQTLTPQQSDSDLRALENIGRLLGYQPPVWLWQLCHSEWSQAGREEQAVGATFAARAKPEEVSQQLDSLIPRLRVLGMAQIAQHLSHDFLLRLGERLVQGDSERWQARLTPWLHAAQPRVFLRGLMFSLPERGAVVSGNDHALTLANSWQGVVSDCTRLRGRRVGLPWQQALTWALMTIIGLWGAGLLLAFALNRSQIVSVAQKARALVQTPAVSDRQLTDLHALRNEVGLLRQRHQHGTPWYRRFGLDHNTPLLEAMMPWYGVANNRLIRDPASAALQQPLRALAGLPPNSPLRAERAKPGYQQLKAWLMMAHPDKGDGAFYAQVMKTVQPTRDGISPGLWQSLAPDLWAFYISELPHRPQWKVIPDPQLVGQSRQVLLEQIGRRNAESTLYENMLQSVGRNVADLTLEQMTGGTDARRLFTTEKTVPGTFTRQAWEGGVQQAIAAAAQSRRDEIDWVLSDGRSSLSADLSPEALQARLTQRYFTEFAGHWLTFLNSLRLKPAASIADVTDQLTLMSDVRQSPLIALMNALAWQGQAGQAREALSDSLINSAKALVGSSKKPLIDPGAAGPPGPLDETFGPLLALLGINHTAGAPSGDDRLSLQTYLTRITRLRLRLQQVAGSADPQAMMQTLAQTVFQGRSIDLTDIRQYGSLIAASLGEEWSGFGQALFVQPLAQAWETVLQPSAAGLNDKWQQAVRALWRDAFEGRYPFAASNNDASLPMLAEFLRKDSGRIEQFLNAELGGVLHKEGSRWVPDRGHGQGLVFNPAFINALNQLSQLSDVLFTDGGQGISFALQARPTGVVQTLLTIDGQQQKYFNQRAEWQTFRWPGDTFKPGTMLTWSTAQGGTRLFGDYGGTWGLIRWLEQGSRQQLGLNEWLMSFTAPDGHILEWALRSELGSGPLALLQLRNFTLPAEIFSVDRARAAQALSGKGDRSATQGGFE